ncbi:MAG: hypothetical protein ACP5OG_03260 [Candidatus Nanoarchaeia archaeon]
MDLILQTQKKLVETLDEIPLQKGDLLMLTRKDPKSIDYVSVLLGVLKDIEKSGLYTSSQKFNRIIFEDPAFNLRPCLSFGKQNLPRIDLHPKPAYRGDFPQFTWNKNTEMYREPEEIAKQLRKMPGYEGYADLVEKMQKPYLIKDF